MTQIVNQPAEPLPIAVRPPVIFGASPTLVRVFTPEELAEAARNPMIARTLHDALRTNQRDVGAIELALADEWHLDVPRHEHPGREPGGRRVGGHGRRGVAC